ncbi:hypothetical protein [Neptuniibacter caesariensis]|uniref:Uncharacterized protein n=1 Tax=Neptuniibacter caesariensis TaxID=207954 RepID=A0A7U8C3R6_NEPCE|nr:hypothetical protein [Neptuniibacter caesariensis]EAR60689.1 hypothetical protein MED92_13478 [Neptuniibacter caesariensis]
MSLSRFLVLSSVLLISACNSAGVKSESSPDVAPGEQKPMEISPTRTLQTKSNTAPSTKPGELKPASQLDIIANRLTAVQDHLLQIKTQSGTLQQQNQALAVQLQALKTNLDILQASADQQQGESEQATSPDAFNGVLDQITMMANELSSQVQDGAYRVSSTYTAKGQWVLIRFHRYTGETWLADKGQWNLLEETDGTGTAEYEVVVLRADKDVKGYVATRINRISGDTWWLKQNTWQPYLSN